MLNSRIHDRVFTHKILVFKIALVLKSSLCWKIWVIFNTSFYVVTGFSIQSLSFRNTKISTLARFQHETDFEHKSFKSVDRTMTFTDHIEPYASYDQGWTKKVFGQLPGATYMIFLNIIKKNGQDTKQVTGACSFVLFCFFFFQFLDQPTKLRS
jgi:hypothetical protein